MFVNKPWGYDEDPNDPDQLLPNQHALRCLEIAPKLQAKGYTLKEIAEWLSEESGSNITPAAVRNRILIRKRRSQRATLLRQAVIRYGKAVERLQNAEQSIPKKSDYIAGSEGSVATRPYPGWQPVNSSGEETQETSNSTGTTGPEEVERWKPSYKYCPTCGSKAYLPPQSGSTD